MSKRFEKRDIVYDLYWRFAAERQATFQRRVSGLPGPWTEDPIIRTYKFCNVYRAADRVSQFLISDIACADHAGTHSDRLFQIVAFRTLSRIESWLDIKALLGRSPTLADLKSGQFEVALTSVKKRGKLYTSAFILCATKAYGHELKHENHAALFKDMFLNKNLADRIVEARSLESVYKLLHQFPLMGDFMSYQTAIDLNYSDLVNFSENDFTKPGPGALRGLKKVFQSIGDYSPEDVIQWMVDNQEREFQRLGLSFSGLWGRPLHAIDCQGLFCEVDKYCREALPELASQRTRIKARFSPSPEQMYLYFPPKWGLNDQVPQRAVLGIPHLISASA